MNQSYQLPEEPSKMDYENTNLGAVSLVLNGAEWKSMFGLIKDPQLTMELKGSRVCHPKMSLWQDYFRLIIFKKPADIGKALKTEKLPFCKRHLHL